MYTGPVCSLSELCGSYFQVTSSRFGAKLNLLKGTEGAHWRWGWWRWWWGCFLSEEQTAGRTGVWTSIMMTRC